MSHCSGLVLKVASRCNLNCSYCYVYNAGDVTYREQPPVMSRDVVHKLLARVAEHCEQAGIAGFGFAFHGGEPLLAGEAFYREFVAAAAAIIPDDVSVGFAVQTNGTLLSRSWCDLFNELGVSVGISIDGPPRIHDRYRVDHAGNGSYGRVRRGIECAVQHLDSEPGVLSVIDSASDPDEVWSHIMGLGVPSAEFLFPDATYDSPPPGKSDLGSTPYADWLSRVFDLWYDSGAPVRVEFFEEVVALILGYSSMRHGVGRSQTGALVIETNGDIEPIDYLKVCRPGITKIGANVQTHALSDVLDHPLIASYFDAAAHASDTCQSCAIFNVCGGGDLVHRWSSESDFDNPTVYCADRMKLIVHIQNRVLADLPPGVAARGGVRRYSVHDVQESIASPVDLPRLIDA